MCSNQLKLNDDKTKAILFSTPSLSSCHCLLSSAMVGIYMKLHFRTLGKVLEVNVGKDRMFMGVMVLGLEGSRRMVLLGAVGGGGGGGRQSWV